VWDEHDLASTRSVDALLAMVDWRTSLDGEPEAIVVLTEHARRNLVLKAVRPLQVAKKHARIMMLLGAVK
jgi:hypothetical protein